MDIRSRKFSIIWFALLMLTSSPTWAQSSGTGAGDGPDRVFLPGIDLSISVTPANTPFIAGSPSQAVYTITITNNESVSLATFINLDITRNLPVGVTEDSAVFTDGGWSGGVAVNKGPRKGVLTDTWEIASLAGFNSATLTLSYTVDSSVADGAQINIVGNNFNLLEGLLGTGPHDFDVTTDIQREWDPMVEIETTETMVYAGFQADTPTFTVRIANNGPSDASNVTLTVLRIFPAGVDETNIVEEFGSLSGTTWTIPEIPAGENKELYLTYTAQSSAPDGSQISLDARMPNANESQTGSTSDDSDSTFTDINRKLDIMVTQVESADPIFAGSGLLTYTITAVNQGWSDAANVSMNHMLSMPTEVTVNNITPLGGGSYGGGTWTLGNMPAGTSQQLIVALNVPPNVLHGDMVQNSLTLNSISETIFNTGDDNVSDTTTINRQVDLRLTATESVTEVIAGSGAGNLVHTMSLTNLGPSHASGILVTVDKSIPTGVTLDNVNPAAGTNLNIDGDWNIPDLAPGQMVELTLIYTAGQSAMSGNIISTSTSIFQLNENRINLGDDAANASTPIVKDVDLALSQTESVDPAIAGLGPGNLVYDLTVTNNSAVAASGVVVTTSLTSPSGVSVSNVTPSGATTFTGNTWNVGNLASGASETLRVTLNINPFAEVGTDVIIHAATVSANETLINTGDDSVSTSTSIDREVDFRLDRFESSEPALAGGGPGGLTYRIDITNTGPSRATNVTLNEVLTLPAGVSVESVSFTAGSFADPTWSIPTMPFGTTESLTVSLTIDSSAQVGADVISHTATVTGASETIINGGDDTVTESTSITREVDLTVTQIESADPVTPGTGPGNLVYTAFVINNGPSDASGVSLNTSHTLPSGVSLDSVLPQAGTSYAGSTWTVGNLPVGAQRSLIFTLTVGATTEPGVDVISNGIEIATVNEPLFNTGDDQVQDLTTVAVDPPDFDMQPADVDICEGDTASFQVSVVDNTGVTFQWRKDGAAIPGETGSALKIDSVTANDAGNYDCVATGPNGSATSNTAALSVLSTPDVFGVSEGMLGISAGRGDLQVSRCVGDAVLLTVQAAGDNLSYQWKKDGVDLPGETSDSLDLQGVSNQDAGSYTCLVRNNCGSETSPSAILSIIEAIKIGTQPQSTTAVAGATTVFSIGVDGTDPQFQWYKDEVLLPGETNSTLVLTNLAAEDAGTYTCEVSNTCGEAFSQPAELTITQEAVSLIEFAQPSYTVSEDGGNAVIGITRTVQEGAARGVEETVSVTFETLDGTAVGGQDYTAVQQQVIFEPGQMLAEITIPILQDEIQELPEIVVLQLSNPSAGAALGLISLGVLTITDSLPDISVIQFSQFTYNIPENGETAVIAITRTSQANSTKGEETVSVFFETMDGTATGGVDYTAVQQEVVFATGQNRVEVAIPIIADGEQEGPETVLLHLSNPSGAILGPISQSVLTISDRLPGTIQFTRPEYVAQESSGLAQIVVTRSGGSAGAVTAQFQTMDDTAVANSDYTPIEQTVSFADGSIAPVIIAIPLVQDNAVEGLEKVKLNLSNPTGGALLGETSHAVLNIVDVDPDVLRLGQLLFSASENRATVEVVVTRSGTGAGEASCVLRTVNESAMAGSDYMETAATVHFAEGDLSPKTVSIPIIDDDQNEDGEFFRVQIRDAGGFAVIGAPSSAIINIDDNDESIEDFVVQWAVASRSVSEAENAKTINVSAILSKPSNQTVTAAYFVGGTARPGEDHNLTNGALSFAPGTVRAVLSFDLFDDNIKENQENISLSLGNVENAVLGETVTFNLTIVDNDTENLPPETVIVSPMDGSQFKLGDSVAFQASGSDPEREALTFFWNVCFTGGGCRELRGQNPGTLTFDRVGIYEITCTASDASGNFDPTPARARIRVSQENIPPMVMINSPSMDRVDVDRGDTRTFTATASDPDSENLMLRWSILNQDGSEQSGESATYTFDQNGIFVVKVEAMDGEGAKDSDWVAVTVTDPDDRPLRAQIQSPNDETVVEVGQPVNFSGALVNAKSLKKEPEFAWLTGDGRRLNGQNVENVVYTRAGRYQIKFLVQEGSRRYLDTATIFVREPQAAPLVDINLPTNWRLQPSDSANKLQHNSELFFQGRVRNARGYEAGDLSYFWDFGNGVTRFSATPGRISFTEEGEYTVSMYATTPEGVRSNTITRTIIVAAASDSEFEPNDSFNQAPIIVPGDYDNLELTEESADDFYRVQVSRNGQRLVIRAVTDLQATVEIYNTRRQLIRTQTVTGEQTIQVNGLTLGDYYVRVNTDAAKLKKAGLSYGMNIAVLNPSLYFPEVQETPELQTQIGMVNPTSVEATVEIIGYRADGSLVDTIQLTIPGSGRLNLTAADLFKETASEVNWARVDSTVNLVGYAVTKSRDEKELYAVSSNNKLSGELYIPHIAVKTEQWDTRAAVINAGSEPTDAVLQAGNINKTLPTLNDSFGQESFLFVDKLDGQIPEDASWGVVKDQNASLFLSGIEIFGKNDDNRQVAGLSMVDPLQDNPNFTYIRNDIYFTHVARDVSRFWTAMALVNISSATQSFTIRAFNDEGTEINSKTITLAGNEKLVQLADEFLSGIATPDQVSWTMVEADSGIVGFELFGTHNNKQLAGFEAANFLRDELCFPFFEASGRGFHGVSVVNVSDAQNTLNLTLYDDNGVVLGQTTQTLPPMGKLLADLSVLFPNIPEDSIPGWLSCQSTGMISGFELFGDNDTDENLAAIVAQ